MEPPVHFWTMRLESKHKVFTDIAKARKNFKNITKTMANEHQERICKPPEINDKIVTSMNAGQFSNTLQYKKYEGIINDFSADINIDALKVHKCAKYGTIEFREGSLILFQNRICEILHLFSEYSSVFFICVPHRIVRRDIFCNSFVIERNVEFPFVLDLKRIKSKLVFDKILNDGEFHVALNSLAIASLFK